MFVQNLYKRTVILTVPGSPVYIPCVAIRRRISQRGQSIVEACLLFPWFVLLFIGAMDAGFDLYALIGVQSAARIAVLYTSTSSSTANATAAACTLVLQDLNYMPNINGKVTSCSSSAPTTAAPLEVTATGPTTDQFGNSYSTVSVSYLTTALLPIPGVLAAQFTITRTAQMQLRS
jgi:hypothetical protein